MTNNGQSEFHNEAGIFSLKYFEDLSVFHVSAKEDQTLALISAADIETPPMATPPVSQSSSSSFRRVLVTVRVIRADITLDIGKPSDIRRYKLTVHVNIYR